MTVDPKAVRSDRGHILILVENLPVPFDRRVWMEATTLRDAGYAVTIICPGSTTRTAQREELERITIWRHPLREAAGGSVEYVREYVQALQWESRLAWRVWRERPFDAVHLCNPPDLLFLVALPFKARGVRVLFDHHDLGPELFVTKFGRKGWAHALLRGAERLTFATADHVIATNESYAAIARERGRKGLDDVTVVRSAPDLSRFVRTRAQRSLDAGGPPTLGYVGIMAEQDGVDLLVRAVGHLVRGDDLADLRVVLIGDGPARHDLERLVATEGLTEVVRFTGYLSGEALLDELTSFDVGVCPDPKDPYNDKCTMNKVLEYMALGIPLVQFDLVEGRRSAGEASLYAGPDNDPRALANAIRTLLGDAALRDRLGAVGVQRMRDELEWRHQAPRLLAAYDRLLLRRRS